MSSDQAPIAQENAPIQAAKECTICHVSDEEDAIMCQTCKLWNHRSCLNLSERAFRARTRKNSVFTYKSCLEELKKQYRRPKRAESHGERSRSPSQRGESSQKEPLSQSTQANTDNQVSEPIASTSTAHENPSARDKNTLTTVSTQSKENTNPVLEEDEYSSGESSETSNDDDSSGDETPSDHYVVKDVIAHTRKRDGRKFKLVFKDGSTEWVVESDCYRSVTLIERYCERTPGCIMTKLPKSKAGCAKGAEIIKANWVTA